MNKLIDFILRWFRKQGGDLSAYENPSPKPRFKRADFGHHLYDDGTGDIVMTISGLKPGVEISTVADTGSEDPIVDAGHFIICEPDVDIDDLVPGDWIIFDRADKRIAHHILKIGRDVQGWCCQTMGSNCVEPDREWVRPEQIRFLIRGVLY